MANMRVYERRKPEDINAIFSVPEMSERWSILYAISTS
jgi:hypothetical protein